jgi:hypothetical protein
VQSEVDKLKAERKATARHILFEQLPEEARFDRLRVQSKHLVDTIKMIAYRAETAMAQVLRESLSRPDDARTLLRGLYATEADLLPDESNQTLTVRLHRQANASTDTALQCLCDELNSTETVFPGTNLRLVYELVSAQNSSRSGGLSRQGSPGEGDGESKLETSHRNPVGSQPHPVRVSHPPEASLA